LSEGILQILLILAYLAIGLLSVTFPVYAIAVTYLPREKAETEKKRRKQIEATKKQLKKQLEQAQEIKQITKIKKQIEMCEEESAALSQPLSFLTAKGAVGFPVVLLLLAMIFAGIGIALFYTVSDQAQENWVYGFTFFSAFCSVMAVYSLYQTVKTVETAALRPAPMIEFEICYDTGNQTKEVKLNQESILEIQACTSEASLEYFEMGVFVPPEIRVTKSGVGVASALQRSMTEFPGYTLLVVKQKYVAASTWIAVGFTAVATKIGKYKIPVYATAKGIDESHGEVILNVVET
jgi:ABC-type multidrug transport system fused ATPase/permease subunit